MKRQVVMGTAGVALGMALVATLVIKAHAAPASPSLAWLNSHGFIVSQLNATSEPISMAKAEAAVFDPNAFPLLSKSTPMTAELVTLEVPGNEMGLGRPQPVWLVTWAQTTTSSGPVVTSASASVTVWQHMNAAISATTGQPLLLFQSP